MTDIKNQEHIDELRRRLYERGGTGEARKRHELTPREISVSRGWGGVPGTLPVKASVEKPVLPITETVPVASPTMITPDSESAVLDEDFRASVMPAKKPRRRYRMVILLASVVMFVAAVAVSSIYLFFGGNQISADNISLTLTVPFTLAGGEVAAMQVSVANQNSVPIESAVLIVNYPSGTKSVDEGNRELYEARIPVEAIAPGEAINIPVRAILYGEENEEKEVKVAIEYRVKGSSGAFYKEAPAQLIKISSSPVAVRVTGVEKISSGQEMELRILVQSNTASMQRNVLVSTSYPNSFAFVSSEPEPAYGDNSWILAELPPGGSTEIVVRGSVTGQANEASEVQVKVGNPQLNNQFMMGSVLSQSKLSYVIEKPFTGVTVSINGDADGEAVLNPGDEAEVKVTVKNTLEEAIYDMRVELRPEGNLIRDDKLQVTQGYFDASAKTIRYDVSGQSDLAEIGPGESREFTFRVLPDRGQGTAGFTVSANVFARRVNESQAAEVLIGNALAEAKYSSEPSLGVELGYGNASFEDTGAVPPVAGLATTYTVTLVAGAGVNDMTSAVVTTNLPQYVSWLDATKGDGAVEFNPVSKQLRWVAGDVSAGKSKTMTFQVSLVPSTTQVGRTVAVIGAQELRATDRFTGVALRAQQKELINELSTELGFVRDNGVVQAAD
jgi:Domain of unknown function DUF11